jgi:hypothetical protein
LAPSLNKAALPGVAATLASLPFLTDGFSGAGFAVAALDPVAAAGGDFCGAVAFNFFDVALCDAVAGFLTDFLADVFAAVRFCPVPDFWADVFDAFLEGVLGDFLRVFLDIRLPFVAFSGSIIAVLRVLRWNCQRWANLPTSEYGYNGFCATTHPHSC